MTAEKMSWNSWTRHNDCASQEARCPRGCTNDSELKKGKQVFTLSPKKKHLTFVACELNKHKISEAYGISMPIH
jgi:hypothetical protein